LRLGFRVKDLGVGVWNRRVRGLSFSMGYDFRVRVKKSGLRI
jgi:hypothetical protein